MIDKIVTKFNYYKVLVQSIIFNLRVLPYSQAKKLPIFVYNLHVMNGLHSGEVKIESENIKKGMIKIGIKLTPKYPDTGVKWENNGLVVFKGSCIIGSNSFLSVGKNGILTFGNDVIVNSTLNIMCARSITIGNHTLFGWETTIMDTSFHPLYDMNKKEYIPATRPIKIGDNNWTGMQCLIMPGVDTPEHCVFGARSIVTRGYNYEPYCLYGGSPIHLLKRGVQRILGHDNIDY